MSYSKHDDEPPPYMECEECGETYPADILHNMLCEECLDERVTQENMELAQETFMKTVMETVVSNPKRIGLLIGVLSEWIIHNGDEDTLHTLSERIKNAS